MFDEFENRPEYGSQMQTPFYLRVNEEALKQASKIIHTWLGSVWMERGFLIGTHQSNAHSRCGFLVVDPDNGLWNDCTSGYRGLCLVSLYAYLNGTSLPSATVAVAAMLEMGHD